MDHHVVDFAARLPASFKISGWSDKRLLRQFATRVLPPATARRKKQPFYMPLERYFQQPTFRRLFSFFQEDNVLQDMIAPSYIRSLSLDNPTLLKSKQLFALMILNSWCKQFIYGTR